MPSPELKPERSSIWSAGVAFNPSKALNTTVDLYYLKQKDSINLLDGQYLIDHEFDIPGYAELVTRDPRNPVLEARYPGLKNGRLKYLTLPYMNVGGVDPGRMPSRTVWDLSVGYTGWQNLKLKLTVLNVFDIKPRFSTGCGGFYDERYGPTIQLAARYTVR